MFLFSRYLLPVPDMWRHARLKVQPFYTLTETQRQLIDQSINNNARPKSGLFIHKKLSINQSIIITLKSILFIIYTQRNTKVINRSINNTNVEVKPIYTLTETQRQLIDQSCHVKFQPFITLTETQRELSINQSIILTSKSILFIIYEYTRRNTKGIND